MCDRDALTRTKRFAERRQPLHATGSLAKLDEQRPHHEQLASEVPRYGSTKTLRTVLSQRVRSAPVASFARTAFGSPKKRDATAKNLVANDNLATFDMLVGVHSGATSTSTGDGATSTRQKERESNEL